MTTYVIDANVVLKWVFPSNDNEDHVDQALGLLSNIEKNECGVCQPLHWMAEVVSVVSRVAPDYSLDIVGSLHSMNFQVKDEIGIYELASTLSIKYEHHLFDTLYHAVALSENDAFFITADDRYYRKAKNAGAMIHLKDLN